MSTKPEVFIPSKGDSVEVTIRGVVTHFGGSNRILVIRDAEGKTRFFHYAPYALHRDPGITVQLIPDVVRAVG